MWNIDGGMLMRRMDKTYEPDVNACIDGLKGEINKILTIRFLRFEIELNRLREKLQDCQRKLSTAREKNRILISELAGKTESEAKDIETTLDLKQLEDLYDELNDICDYLDEQIIKNKELNESDPDEKDRLEAAGRLEAYEDMFKRVRSKCESRKWEDV